MAAIDFPSNPSVGDPYVVGDVTYVWTGTVWNAGIANPETGVTTIVAGTGIKTTPTDGTGSSVTVAVNDTVVVTTGAQTIAGVKTFNDGIISAVTGNITTDQIAITNGASTQIGSITGTTNTRLTLTSVAAGTGIDLVAPADQRVDVISGTTTYARFNNATESLMIGGTIPATPGVQIAGTSVTATSFIGNASSATELATARDIQVKLTGDATGQNQASFDGTSDISISVPVTLSATAQFWERDGTVISTANAGDTIYTTGDIECGGTSTADATIELNGSTGNVKAVSFEGDGSALTGLPRSVNFKGTINATNTDAPTTPAAGDFYLNTTAGTTKDGSWAPLDQTAIAQDQFIFYALDAGAGSAGWVLGGVSDVSTYVTLGTTQSISGQKTFTSAVKVGTDKTTLFANGGISTPLGTITASDFNLHNAVNWTVGAVTVPNPTNVVAGMAGSIIVTAAPTGWGSNYKFPSPDAGVTDGTAPALANFPVVLPYLAQDATTILIGNPTIY